ncbi:MAG: hypothetical protein JST42_01060 [Bacteroidetes bacterium]|nr:hypothetical protein [Bacteroidota bacterium]
MQSTIVNIRKAAVCSLFTLTLAGASLVSRANNGNEGKKGETGKTSANTADLKYIADKDGSCLFNVVYNNISNSRFSVVILDAEGDQLFQSQYSDKKFDRKFKLAQPEDFGRLTFIIRNLADNTVQRFEVDANSRLVEDVEVKEVK